MTPSDSLEQLRRFEVPGVISFHKSGGSLPSAKITTPWSNGEIYLHGAQITDFRKRGEPPLLFLSERSRFALGKAIRGGVPICLPWFGPRTRDVAHGFARITAWELKDASVAHDGAVSARFALPVPADRKEWQALEAEFSVVMSDRLTMELQLTNRAEGAIDVEACLHTYFAVSDISQVTVTGLEGAAYFDHLVDNAPQPGAAGPIRITAQTDRTYPDSTGTVEIHDSTWRRKIKIEKTGSASTVVWNPWTTQPLADLAPEEYRRLICVESGNIGADRLRLSSGTTARLTVTLTSIS